MGFTKLDAGILQSSIIAEDSDTLKVWIILLASCRPDGIAPISELFISGVGHMAMENVLAALGKLEGPDKYSRTRDNEGRRIRRVDGGFLIINYQYYRSVWHYSHNPESVRKRQLRQFKSMAGTSPDKSGHIPDSPDVYASVLDNKIESSSLSPESIVGHPSLYQDIMRQWNEIAVLHALPTISGIRSGSTRIRQINRRIAEYGLDFLAKVKDIISRSPFLIGEAQGKKEHPFLLTFDWLICPSNYVKVLEGNYLERDRPAARTGSKKWERFAGKDKP